MLIPKKVKYRKQQRRGMPKGVAGRGYSLSYGDYGLKAIEGGKINSRQIEAARRAMTRFIQRGGKIWIRIFPHQSITSKGAETPMGKGKGTVDHYIAKIRPGCLIFEMDGVEKGVAREAMRLAAFKLPVKTKFVNK